MSAAVPRRQRAARIVGVFVGVFALLQFLLVLAAELSFRVRDPYYGDREAILSRAEASRPGGPRILLIGTSRGAYAFHGLVAEEHLSAEFPNVVAFNFGIPSSGPVTHLLYLRRLLDRGHRPDLLLVEALPPSLSVVSGRPNEARFLFGDRLTRGEVEATVGYGFPAGEMREQWLATVTAPWHARRLPLLGRLSPSALPPHLRWNAGRTVDPRGWGTPPLDHAPPDLYREGFARAAVEYRDILADLQPTGGAARALADIAGLCREKGVPLKLVLMPEDENFRALYPPPMRERVEVFLRDVCRDHGCDLIDATGWVPDGQFADGHHLLRGGAKLFTDRLTRDVIAPFLRGRGP